MAISVNYPTVCSRCSKCRGRLQVLSSLADSGIDQSLKKIAILRGAIFAQISPFRAKSQFFANFASACNFCANFGKFGQICNLAEGNFSQNSQILQFARNLRKLRAILAHFQRNFGANSTNCTKNSVVLRLPYCISETKP